MKALKKTCCCFQIGASFCPLMSSHCNCRTFLFSLVKEKPQRSFLQSSYGDLKPLLMQLRVFLNRIEVSDDCIYSLKIPNHNRGKSCLNVSSVVFFRGLIIYFFQLCLVFLRDVLLLF